MDDSRHTYFSVKARPAGSGCTSLGQALTCSRSLITVDKNDPNGGDVTWLIRQDAFELTPVPFINAFVQPRGESLTQKEQRLGLLERR